MRPQIALIIAANVSSSSLTAVDFCRRLAVENFNKLSVCNVESGKCSYLYWDSLDKVNIVYEEVDASSVSMTPVSCSAAMSFFERPSGKRKADSPLEVLSSRQRSPDWYDDSKSAAENLNLGLSSMIGKIRTNLTPRLAIWPVGTFRSVERSTASRIIQDADFIKTFVNFRDVSQVRPILNAFRKENLHWRRWRMYLEDWFEEATFLRFDQGSLLKFLFPYLQVHRVMMEILFAKDILMVESERFKFSAVMEMESEISFGDFSPGSSYSFFHGAVANFIALADELRLRVADMWPELSDPGKRKWVVADIKEKEKLGEFEIFFSRLMMSADRKDNGEQIAALQDLVCPFLVEFTAYISWVWRPPVRKANRLIASLNGMLCMQATSLEDRRRMIALLPVGVMNTGSLLLSLPSDPEEMIFESLIYLRHVHVRFDGGIIVEFRDTLAAGHTGPRAHWLSVLFEHIFTPGNGFFEYADPISMQHIKPVAFSENKNFDMLAVGRVIGLAIKYGLTIGARITPCGLALLRLPRESFSLEECVKEEDPIFVSSLNQVAEAFDWENKEAAKEYLATFTEDDVTLTRETFPSYKRHKLYNKGLSPIRMSYLFIKKGIRSVLPAGALELFTETEFDIMINGHKTLSAETLLNGIRLVRQPRGSLVFDWLREIMEEETDDFRFAFNQFVTAVKQPPVRNTSPWIKLEIDPKLDSNSLPRVQTCYEFLRIPDYTSKEMLKNKLSTAVLEGNASLELN